MDNTTYVNNLDSSIGDSSTLEIMNTTMNITTTTGSPVESDPTKVALKEVMSVLLVVLLAVIMMSLGCTIELNALKKQIKKPLPPIIGMLLQFVAYPLVVFGMAHAFQLNSYDAIGMLLIGTCPGGSLSNLITFWSHGDVVLSVCMTSFSTAIAIGMMPLNLFIYTRSFTKTTLTVPYVKIIIALVLILIPVSIGMLIMRKFPKVAKIVVKVGGAIGFLFILLVISIQFYLYPQMFKADWKLWFAAILLPIFGLVVGYIGSLVTCLSHKQCRTVAIEVSSQNVALCMTIIFISFKLNEATKIIMFPLIFGVFNVLVLVIVAIICMVTFYFRKKNISVETNDGRDIKMTNISSSSNDLQDTKQQL